MVTGDVEKRKENKRPNCQMSCFRVPAPGYWVDPETGLERKITLSSYTDYVHWFADRFFKPDKPTKE